LISDDECVCLCDLGGDVPDAPALEKVNSLMSTTSYISIEEVKTGAEEAKPPKREKEAPWHVITNPSRVIPAQVRFLSLGRPGTQHGGVTSPRDSSSMEVDASDVAVSLDSPTKHGAGAGSEGTHGRYKPVDIGRREKPFGIVMLLDNTPDAEPDTAVQKVVRVALGKAALLYSVDGYSVGMPDFLT
jgi:hypothetical protein